MSDSTGELQFSTTAVTSDTDIDNEEYQQNVFNELMKPESTTEQTTPNAKTLSETQPTENGFRSSPSKSFVEDSDKNISNVSSNIKPNETRTSLEVNYNDTTFDNTKILNESELNDDAIPNSSEDTSLRQAIMDVTTTEAGHEESPLKPLQKTFFGGVRYFASTENIESDTAENEENPFAPRKPIFRAVRRGRRGRSGPTDLGEKPLSLFGDVEYKFECPPEPNGSSLTDSPSYANYDAQAELDKIDRSLTDSLQKPAHWKRIIKDRSIIIQPSGGRGRGGGRGGRGGRGRGRGRTAGYVKNSGSVPTIFKPGKPAISEAYTPLSADEQSKADLKSTSYTFTNGARVFAKWPDKNHYPGNVLSFDGFGKYRIRFLDGEIREMPATSIVALVQLKVEDFLMVSVSGEQNELIFQPSSIIACPDPENVEEWHIGLFEVENKVKRNKEKVSWDKFVLDSFQAKKLITARMSQYVQDINTPGSISETKGRRSCVNKRTKKDNSDDDDYVYYDDNDDFGDDEFRRPRKRGKYEDDGDEDDWDDFPDEDRRKFTPNNRPPPKITPTHRPSQPSVTTYGQKRSFVPATGQVIRNKAGQSSVNSTNKLANVQVKSVIDNKRLDAAKKFAETIVVIKPYQPEKPLYNKSLFAGILFVMTSATRTKDNSGPEDVDNAPPIPFNKRIIRQHIEESGGTVLDDFAQVDDVSNNCYLIADTHYRTHKYLSSLVRAIPCVSHMWILDCVKDGTFVPATDYMLPSGRSLETGQIIPWHDKCLTLLNGVKMHVYTENRHENPALLDFSQIWTPICRSMGATTLDSLPDDTDNPDNKFDILLTDITCSQNVVDKAKALNASSVSSEWLIQAIITGDLPIPSGHPKYRHDYVENQQAGS